MKLGAYEVLAEIGRGGMGVVVKARAPGGEVVAVKVLHRAMASRALERFEREGRLLASGKVVRTFKGHTYELMDMAVSLDGRRGISAANDRSARVWNLEEAGSAEAVSVFKGHTAKVTSAALSPDGRLALSGSDDRTIRLWDATSGSELSVLDLAPGCERPSALAFLPDGRSFVAGTDRGLLFQVELR